MQLGKGACACPIHILRMMGIDEFVVHAVNETDGDGAISYAIDGVETAEVVIHGVAGLDVGEIDNGEGRQMHVDTAKLSVKSHGFAVSTVCHHCIDVATQAQKPQHRCRTHAFAVKGKEAILTELSADEIDNGRKVVTLVIAQRGIVAVATAEIGVVVNDDAITQIVENLRVFDGIELVPGVAVANNYHVAPTVEVIGRVGQKVATHGALIALNLEGLLGKTVVLRKIYAHLLALADARLILGMADGLGCLRENPFGNKQGKNCVQSAKLDDAKKKDKIPFH